MGFKWTRCRRCGRGLTNPVAVRAGIGPECVNRKDPPTRVKRVALMAGIDYILDHHPDDWMRDIAAQAAKRIEDSRNLTASLTRLILREGKQKDPTMTTNVNPFAHKAPCRCDQVNPSLCVAEAHPYRAASPPATQQQLQEATA